MVLLFLTFTSTTLSLILATSPVCKTDAACVGFPLPGAIRDGLDDDTVANMTCYGGGETVFSNHQMCDITSKLFYTFLLLHVHPVLDRKILDMLPDRPPQVTFSCDNATSTCSFQFWAAQQESFYCGLDSCISESKPGYDTDSIAYACDKIKCKCIPGKFLCGEDGSVGTSSWLLSEIHAHVLLSRYFGLPRRRNPGTRNV
jgi:hypothetical protein